MALWHLRSKRKPTGGRYHRVRKKRKNDQGSLPTETKIGEMQVRKNKVTGGTIKLQLSSAKMVNLADPKTGKIKKVKVVSVKENEANPHFVRRNIVTKGAVIETEAGPARVSSRPGQDGIVNAILLEEKK